MWQKSSQAYSAYMRKMLIVARINEFSLMETLNLRKRFAEAKRQSIKKRKFGAYLDWENVEYEGLYVVVPNRSNKDNEILEYQVIDSANEAPDAHQRHIETLLSKRESDFRDLE